MGVCHINAVGKDETALKLTGGNTPMQEHSAIVGIILTPAHDQLLGLDRHIELLIRETGDSERDAVLRLADLFDIVRRVTVIAGFCRALDQPFKVFKTQKKRVCGKRYFIHTIQALVKATIRAVPYRQPRKSKMGFLRVQNKSRHTIAL